MRLDCSSERRVCYVIEDLQGMVMGEKAASLRQVVLHWSQLVASNDSLQSAHFEHASHFLLSTGLEIMALIYTPFPSSASIWFFTPTGTTLDCGVIGVTTSPLRASFSRVNALLVLMSASSLFYSISCCSFILYFSAGILASTCSPPTVEFSAMLPRFFFSLENSFNS